MVTGLMSKGHGQARLADAAVAHQAPIQSNPSLAFTQKSLRVGKLDVDIHVVDEFRPRRLKPRDQPAGTPDRPPRVTRPKKVRLYGRIEQRHERQADILHPTTQFRVTTRRRVHAARRLLRRPRYPDVHES